MQRLNALVLPSERATVDVLIASDMRFPGGTSHSIAEEVTAQHRAGYRTGLVHLNGPLIEKLRPVNPLLRRQVLQGAADLLIGADPVQTRLLVLRHPAVAQHSLDQLPPVRAEHVVVVANAGPDDIDGRNHYEPALVDAAVREHVGQEPLWAPIGPLVRNVIAADIPPERLLEQDWVNIIDVDAWASDRPDWCSDRPVIGRHSRHSPQKWPSDAETIRAVYPVDGSWDVRILGGAEPAIALLGAQPDAWQVREFGAMPPKEFLAELDFFVYYHDPRWVEAFGRTILEAIASGAVAILPPHFEALFGAAARYAEPEQVPEIVTALRADRDTYLEQARRAGELVRSRFGYEAHLRRLSDLVGSPESGAAGVAAGGAAASGSVIQGADPDDCARPDNGPRPDSDAPVTAAPDGSVHPEAVLPPAAPGSHAPRGTLTARTGSNRVLLMSSNGAGMGHLTRLLAYARHLGEGLEPYFLSMSQAAPVVSRFGFQYEYLPSAGALAMAPSAWQGLFVDRMTECLNRLRPRAVVFDGTWPYNGFPVLRENFGHISWIWSRRGMWRQGMNTEQVNKKEWFDEVIEPGDFASDYDRGATRNQPSVRVGPVTLLGREERQDRDVARAALDLPADRPLGLISLGAGNINDTRSDVGAATAALRSLGVEVCTTQSEIAVGTGHDDVHVVRDYPLARRYAAFDVVISAAGYNSVQELIRMGIPNLLVPNAETALDDQEARARFVKDQGWSHAVPRIEVSEVVPLLADLLERGSDMVAGAAQRDPGNGAREAAATITTMTDQGT